MVIIAKTITVDYVPSPKQRLFHESTANEVLYGGAAGGGKSKALVMDAFLRCMKTPGLRVFLFRRTFRELEDTLVKEALSSIPGDLGRYSSAAHNIVMINGSVMHFRHCEHAVDMYKYQGVEMHALYVDELTSFTQDVYDYLKTRLRAAKKLGIVPIVRCASNPGGVGHSWVKGRFISLGDPLAIHEVKTWSEVLNGTWTTRIQYIPALATENPHITKDYVIELEKKPDALRRALLLGDWDTFEGKVFVDFVDDPEHYEDMRWSHVIEPFEIPDHWRRYRSFDHGYSKPFSVGWWAMDEKGTAYRYREWYGSKTGGNHGVCISPREIARGIVAREETERREGISIIGVADPSIWDGSQGGSIAEQMEREHVYFMPGDNARLAGKMQLHNRLQFDAEGYPRLYIFKTCEHWLRTVPVLPYDLKKVEDVNTQAEDHAYDETRYFLMSEPVSSRAKDEPTKRLAFDPLDMNESRRRR